MSENVIDKYSQVISICSNSFPNLGNWADDLARAIFSTTGVEEQHWGDQIIECIKALEPTALQKFEAEVKKIIPDFCIQSLLGEVIGTES